jgi:peptide/nickel transport system permease protein
MRFLGRRLLVYALALWGAVTINYLLPRLMPGPSPFDGYASDPNAYRYPKFINGAQTAFGTGHESIWAEYPHYMGQIVRGDIFFGIPGLGSYIGHAIPYSFALAVASTLLAFLVGTGLGALSAWRRGGLLDGLIPTGAMALSSFPPYFVALGAIYVLGIKWHLFPLQYGYDQTMTPGPSLSFASSAFRHAQLPILILVMTYLGFWVLSMRNVMINTIDDEYLVLAHAKGLRGRKILRSYAARNAILVPIAMFAAVFSTSLDGIVVIEKIFSYPGSGLMFQSAVLNKDYLTAQSLLLLFTLSILGVNLLVDVVNVVLDPRLRAS